VYATLRSGGFTIADPRFDDLVDSSLNQFRNNTLLKNMFLDASTVLYRRSAEAAKCHWESYDRSAPLAFQQLIGCSLVKIVDDKLWVHDIIKAIACEQARAFNTHRLTRVWLPDQVIFVTQ
jgi:hypothetical protein